MGATTNEIEAAKSKGVYKGRKKTVDETAIQKLAREGISKAETARSLGISRMTVYRTLQNDSSEG